MSTFTLAACSFCGNFSGEQCMDWPGACLDRKPSASELARKYNIKHTESENAEVDLLSGKRVCAVEDLAKQPQGEE